MVSSGEFSMLAGFLRWAFMAMRVLCVLASHLPGLKHGGVEVSWGFSCLGLISLGSRPSGVRC